MDYESGSSASAPRQTLPTCDSYFVEMDQDDDGVFVAQRSRQEIARMHADTQMDLAEDLSRAVSEEYQEDILDHMENMENETLADVASIDIQTEIQWFMRPYLLDFLIEAHTAFSLLPETLHLTVNLLDRYCSRRVVYKRHYQLVGCAAMLIAAKYGDKKDRVPTIRELKSMCCNLYDEDMFIQMEWHVLQTLGWVVGHPTVESFLQMVLQEVNFDPEVESMARYLAEVALFHKEFVSIRPSVMARTSLALARHILSRPIPTHSEWAGQFDTTVLVLLSQQLHNPSPILVRKYSSPEFASVSTILEDFMARQAAIARQRSPPTPPSEAYDSQRDTTEEKYDPTYMTPQKNAPQAPAGYITPPVTPNSGYYADESSLRSSRVPITPTPTNQPYYVQ
ncbi:Similar to G1/S-specific cyclin CCN1; acc. no. Q59YH3 [Pyronema omphalodes CBS 100304]|uniref:Similar to G1/S-specific cyclin CCN1 acc. no. Q59YH3 n=1 Tax=Pyronema omphalodes (strain CBS 100304) TaxID=1076935 RepID=U4LIP4_PYROM|nr:Similar to G1/S-specific cyclin CCN1; acc. no. Q59YH3 [Pyronema omphalodes CBS 100304]